MTTYYIVAVDDDGDVLAIEASAVNRNGLAITVLSDPRGTCAFENKGEDYACKFEAMRDALAAITPDDESDPRYQLAGELEDAGWPSVAEDAREGLNPETILNRLGEIGEGNSRAAHIVSDYT
jgi:hypothetical protein